MKQKLKCILIDIAVYLAASALFTIFIFYAICCSPYYLFVSIRNAYREDRDTQKMDRDIELFLREQRA